MCFFGVRVWIDLREWPAAVIRVRRRDFASGSHKVAGLQGIAERVPRGVTIYLLPGLTSRQRRAVIRRLRQEASRGCGPELPLAQLFFALLLDRVRGALGLAAAAVRLHPGTTLLPAAFVATVMTLFVLVSAGLGPVPAGRPALAAAQSGSGLGSTVHSAPAARSPPAAPRARWTRAISGRAASGRAASSRAGPGRAARDWARGSRPPPGRARPGGRGRRGSASARCRGWPRTGVRWPAAARPVSRL